MTEQTPHRCFDYDTDTVTALLVEEGQRLTFLPRYFGAKHMILGEAWCSTGWPG